MRLTQLIYFFVLIIGVEVYAQNETYQFNHLGTSDGLSQSSVIAIHQDQLGRMWFGTRDGLNVYDGNNFKAYRNDVEDLNSVSNSDILSITGDRDGYMWVGTYNGLNRYDPIQDQFKRFLYVEDSNSICNNAIWSLKELDNGDIWIGTYNGLSIFNKASGRFISFFHESDNLSSLPSNYILSIEQSSNGAIWIGTSRGLCKAIVDDEGGVSFERFNVGEGIEVPFIQAVTACEQNTLCIGTKNIGALKFDLLSERFLDNSNTGGDQDIRAICIGEPGNIWLGTSDGITIHENDGNTIKLRNHTYKSGSISNNYIKSIFKDLKGSIWVGSYYGGIDIWDPSNTNFINYTDQSVKNRLGNKVVSSIVADDRRNIYLGTEGGGVTIFHNDSDDTEYLNLNLYPHLLSDNIKSIYSEGNSLWIGTFDKGLTYFHLEDKKFYKDRVSQELKDQLGSSGVYAIKAVDKNSLWIGSFGKGLFNYDINQKTFKQFYKNSSDERGLSSNHIRCLLKDQFNNIWIGTQSGLNFLPFMDGSFKNENIVNYFYQRSVDSGDDILSIYQDLSGTIWVGLRAKGLFRFDGNKFEQVALEANQSITSIYSIEEDEDDILWLGTNQGLIRFVKKDQSFKIYTQKDGLVNNEFASGASLKVNGSKFYFGGNGGVSFFDSKMITQNQFTPKVILTDLRIKNQIISPNNGNGILSKSLPYTETINLPYDQSNFSIDYAIPNYINPKSNRYQYRVVGLDDNWTLTEQSRASFTIQKAGEYIFEVKGANNDGLWNEETTALNISVLPPFWKSNLAYLIYALLIAGGLYAVYRAINAKTALEHKLQLEHLSNERNNEINDAKLRFFTNISHEFKTPLTLITGPLQQILRDYKGSSLVYKQLLVIESNAKHLLLLINRLMDFRKLEHKTLQLKASEGNIVKFTEEVFLSFTEYAKLHNYKYSFHKNEECINVFYDRPKIEQVLFNLISNAFKYTDEGGEIKVVIRKEEQRAIIDVSDTGKGVQPQFRDKIFERFFEIPEHKRPNLVQNAGTGIGLSIAKHLIDLHQGKLSVQNNGDVGSIFRVQLQLGKSHLSKEQIVEDFKFSDDLDLYTSQIARVKMDRPIELNEQFIHQEKSTVLIVEDNGPLRNFIKELLQGDYNILQAADGQEAMKKALKYLPDLIISDVMMPIMVGTELCAKIKANMATSHIPVVLLTSRTSLLYKFEGLESGADDYISKPFDIVEFQLRIRNLLESSKRLRTKFAESHSFTPNKVAINSVDEELLKKAITIVEDNISNYQFDIATFCHQLGVSRTLLFTKVKAWTDFTPNEFIQEMRMKRAIQLLEQGKLNVSEICYEVGFRNPKYFSKCFVKKYGISPRGYKEKFSENFYQ